MGEARDITAGDRIAFEIIGDNRHGGGSRSRRLDRGTGRRNQNIDAQLNELLRQSRKYFGPAARPAWFDSDRLTFNVTGITQALTQRFERRRSGLGEAWMKKSDDRHLSRLLRLRERRQCHPGARQNSDEIASTHVMTCR